MMRLLAVAAAAIAALFALNRTEKPTLQVPPRRIGFVWKEEEARAATCAALATGIDDEAALAKVVGETVYPGAAWPPSASASTRAKNIWAKLEATARDALEGGCA